ncbi:MAG: cytochrome C biogenesis protein [Bacteroidetes bacterium MedPE-SWsnd-G2]|nr:MAG: cytochrome C biogenesis protein [Bacteroidetes bacterium MedPE-SWsnd-G2]
MNNNIYKFFSSSKLALLLLLAFAIAMATATFVENDFGTATAWKLIYNAKWFEIIMLGLAICFVANIFKYNLLQPKKWNVLMFHFAFIIILLGAAITRYSSNSGIMRIREGAKSNILISDKNFIQVEISDGNDTKIVNKEIEFSAVGNNEFEINSEFKGKDIKVSYNKFIADALPEIVEDSPNGKALLQMVIAAGSGRETIFLEKGEIEALGEHKHLVGFEVDNPDVINIREENGIFTLQSPRPLDFFIMAEQSAGKIQKDSIINIKLRTLVRDGDVSFVPMSFHPNASIELVSTSDKLMDNDVAKDDALILDVQVGEEKATTQLLYRKGFEASKHKVDVSNLDVTVSYGSRLSKLPFELKLNDFQLERYPGSNSPSAYASEIAVIDNEEVFDYRIFMNNVLDYGGYRFFQASYDTDEKGTVLAVNQDVLGTTITYLGYLLMGIGMFFTLFGKASRFTLVNKKLKKLKSKALMLGLILLPVLGYGQDTLPKANQSFAPINHAELFGRLLVQDIDGRIKPINTLASEFLRKLSRKPYFRFQGTDGVKKLTANQWMLSLHIMPNNWRKIPLIKIDIEKIDGKFSKEDLDQFGLISFDDLLDEEQNYRFAEDVEKANLKKPSERNEFDNEVLKVDERFNILFNLFMGNYLRIFPNKLDENNTWFSFNHDFSDFPKEDAPFVKGIVPLYFNDVLSKDLASAEEKLAYISKYQKVLGKEIIPTDGQIEAELFYNDLNLNFWLFQILFTLGLVLLILALTKIFYTKPWVSNVEFVIMLIIFIAFLAFTANLILRWYIAEHAPWSNGYEMLVFVAWVLLGCGLLTHKKSDFTLALASLFSGALLFVCYLDWLNPEITNLMPVLKSYWLKVHVATIVSSYAPLALSSVLGLMSLILIIIKSPKTSKTIDLRIKELSYVNEISMTIGLFVLAVGTFLGGIWANESWGRYWAWDPKETWALISVIIYAIVLHLRFIPKFNNNYTLNMASMFAFWSIIMTSFGVNYYLSGLHSYATGDPVPIPTFVYVLASIMIIVAVVAYNKHKKRLS